MWPLFYDLHGLRIFVSMPFVNTHDQCPLTFSLMPFGWLHSITLTHDYTIIS
jgi:hypothetical protein